MLKLVIGTLVCVVCLAWILAPGAWGKGNLGAFTATSAAVGSGSADAVAATDAGLSDAALDAAVAESMPVVDAVGTGAPGATLTDAPPDLLVLLAAIGALAVLIMLLLALTGGLKRLPKELRGLGAFTGSGLVGLVAAILGGLTLPESLAAGISAGLAAPGAYSTLKPLLGRLGPLGRILGMVPRSAAPTRITVEMAMNDDPDKVVRSIFEKLQGSTSSNAATPEGENGPK